MQQICTAITDLPTYYIQSIALGLFFSLLRDNNDEKNSAEREFARACWLVLAVSGLGQDGSSRQQGGGGGTALAWRKGLYQVKKTFNEQERLSKVG